MMRPRRPRPRNALLLAAAIGLLSSTMTDAHAHHSFAMFDTSKVISVTGTVQSFSWSMPHVWIEVAWPKTSGTESWGFECHAPNLVARKGWHHDSVKPGDKIAILMHPMRDGSRAGSVIHVTLANGTTLWNADTINSP